MHTLFATSCVLTLLAGPLSGAEPRPAPVIGNRDAPTETQLLALAKAFCVEMRRHHADASTSNFRMHYLDPRYLAQHGLKAGDVPLEMAPVGAIRNIQLAADRRTLLCLVGTGETRREAILLRATLHDGRLYIQPPSPPDDETGRVTPWLLRMEVDE